MSIKMHVNLILFTQGGVQMLRGGFCMCNAVSFQSNGVLGTLRDKRRCCL